MPPWVFLTVGCVLAGAGLALAAWAVFFDRARGRRRCPRCWYDMSGTAGLQCPECGREARSASRLLKTHRRWRSATVGLAAVLLGTASTLTPAFVANGWIGIVPNTALIYSWPDFFGPPPTDPAALAAAQQRGNFVLQRLQGGDLWAWQRRMLVRRCVEVLDDAARRDAHAAALALIAASGPYAGEAVPALRRLLRDPAARLSFVFVLPAALGELGPIACPLAPELVGLLTDRTISGSVKDSIVRVLDQIGASPEQVVPVVIESLRSPDRCSSNEQDDVQWWSSRIEYLAERDEHAAVIVPVLTELLITTYSSRRDVAANALRGFGPAAAPAVPALIFLLNNGDFPARRAATQALGNIGPAAAESADALTSLLNDPDAELRPYAHAALAQINGDTRYAAEHWIAAAQSTDPGVRASAAEVLGDLRRETTRTVPALGELARDSDRSVRRAALLALSRYGPDAEPALPVLIALFESAGMADMVEAGRVLTAIGPPAKAAIDAVRKRTRDDGIGTRNNAIRLLRHLESLP